MHPASGSPSLACRAWLCLPSEPVPSCQALPRGVEEVVGYGVWFPVAITLLTRSRRPSSAEAHCWRPAGVLCLLRGCEVLPRLARCQPRASAQWQGLEDLAAPSLWAQGLLVGQTAPLLSASGLRQEQAGVRPRESAKQAVWALVFVSVAAGATLPPTHLPCRPAGPRHSGCGRRGGALS